MKGPFRQSLAHQFSRSNSAGCDHDVRFRVEVEQTVNQRQHGKRFSHRSAVKPYQFAVGAFKLRTAHAFIEAFEVFFAVLFAFVDVAFDDQRIENADENVVNANEHGKNLISFWDIFFSWPLCPA